MRSVGFPRRASADARLIAVVVFPTPPFWLAMATIIDDGALMHDEKRERFVTRQGGNVWTAIILERGWCGVKHQPLEAFATSL